MNFKRNGQRERWNNGNHKDQRKNGANTWIAGKFQHSMIHHLIIPQSIIPDLFPYNSSIPSFWIFHIP
jgi:hypothetical protein